MDAGEEAWAAVDDYLVGTVVHEDDALAATRKSSGRTATPGIDVAPNQGAFLSILAQAVGARRVLEFGTLAGYSATWLARAVGPGGTVITFEIDEATAAVARENFERAGVADRVDVVVGPAADSAAELVAAGVEPFDLVFIDADKPNNPTYLKSALALSHPGTVIVVDNVVRGGDVANADTDDPKVQGTRTVLEMLGSTPGIEATALQTVGLKAWDGFAIAVVQSP